MKGVTACSVKYNTLVQTQWEVPTTGVTAYRLCMVPMKGVTACSVKYNTLVHELSERCPQLGLRLTVCVWFPWRAWRPALWSTTLWYTNSVRGAHNWGYGLPFVYGSHEGRDGLLCEVQHFGTRTQWEVPTTGVTAYRLCMVPMKGVTACSVKYNTLVHELSERCPQLGLRLTVCVWFPWRGWRPALWSTTLWYTNSVRGAHNWGYGLLFVYGSHEGRDGLLCEVQHFGTDSVRGAHNWGYGLPFVYGSHEGRDGLLCEVQHFGTDSVRGAHNWGYGLPFVYGSHEGGDGLLCEVQHFGTQLSICRRIAQLVQAKPSTW